MYIKVRIYIDIIDSRCFVIQKVVIGVLIGLAAGVIAVKMVVAESPIMGAVDIDQNNIHIEMALMRQNTKDYQPNLRYQ